MKKILILSLLIAVNYSIFGQIINKLPEYHSDYKLVQVSSKSETEHYDAYSFQYRKKNSTQKEDAIFVSFRIYKNMPMYQDQVDHFTVEDATMEYTQIDMGQMAQENFNMDKLARAMNAPEGAGQKNKSEEGTLKDDLKHVKIEDSRFTSADYRYSRNMMGHDTFRAVLTWGKNRYAQITANSKVDGKLQLQEILDFIGGFPFEKL